MLPVDPEALAALQEDSAQAAGVLHLAAGEMSGRLRTRLQRLLEDAARLDTVAETLPLLRAAAQRAHDVAAGTAEKVRVLRTSIGEDPQAVLDRHASACADKARLETKTGPARERADNARDKVSTLQARLDAAQRTERAAQPAADARQRELLEVLTAPGVADALLGDTNADPGADGDVLARVGSAIHGRRRHGRKTLRERYDETRRDLVTRPGR
jgi:hypothetical protein